MDSDSVDSEPGKLVSFPSVQVIDLSDDTALGSALDTKVLPTSIASAIRAADDAQVLDGRYALGDVIGHGSTSVVCRGEDLEFHCPVAIKLLRASGDREDRLRAAIGEAMLARRINSPYVVRVHDAGIDGDAFIVMDLETGSDGSSAGAALSSDAFKPHTLEEALKWFREAALGLAVAHRLGVYHYDLKPDNLLIEPVERCAKLIDFGIEATAGGMGGTPAYMAPEHAQALREGESLKKLDRGKLDIFGLGALAYHLIYGTPLLEPKGSVDDQLAAAANAKPTVKKTLPTRWGRVEPRVAAILRRAIALAPTDRYETPGDVAADVDTFLAGLPLPHERTHYATRLRLWARRSRAAIGAVAIALGGVVTLAILSAHLWASVDAASAELTTLRVQVAVEDQTLTRTQNELAERQAELRRLQSQLVDRTTANEKLKTEVNDLLHKLDLDAKGEQRLRDFISHLGAKLDELARDRDALTKQLADTTAQLVEVGSQRDELGKQLANMDARLKDTTLALADKSKQLDDTMKQLAESTAQLKQIQADLATTRADLVQKQQELDAANAEIANLRKQLTASANTLSVAEGKLIDAQTDLAQAKTDGLALASENARLKARVVDSTPAPEKRAVDTVVPDHQPPPAPDTQVPEVKEEREVEAHARSGSPPEPTPEPKNPEQHDVDDKKPAPDSSELNPSETPEKQSPEKPKQDEPKEPEKHESEKPVGN